MSSEKEIMAELKEFRKDFSDFKDSVWKQNTKTQVAVAELKVKSKVWGAIGGSISVVTMSVFGLFIWFVKSGK